MKQVSIEEVTNELSGYLQMAETEEIVITRQGIPVGILISLDNPDNEWEELLLRHPKFTES